MGVEFVLYYPTKTALRRDAMAGKKSEIEAAREAGRVEARKELGKWLEANMLKSPYRTVYSDILPSMVERLKAGKSL